MRTITKQLVLLAVVFIIYFGYSAWIDGLALYRIATAAAALPAGFKIGDFITDPEIIKTGMIGTVAITYTGIMAQNSLLYAMLSPFKLVLVGGVFALLIPLVKKLFFGTIIAIKDYMKNRRDNLLYNYQAAIAFAQGMKTKLETGDYEQIKAQYATLGGVKFQPQFLLTLMNDVGYALIKETDMSVYINPAQTVIDSLQDMYDSEHRLAITGHPEEMFHDFKEGYNYVSIGSKYNIAYYKAIEDKKSNKNRLGWKLFSLEMYKFYISMILAIIPEIIIMIIVLPLVTNLVGGTMGSQIGISIVFLTYMLFAIAINALMIFLKSQYRLMLKYFILPATIYYVAMLGLAITFAIGLIAVLEVGDIILPQTTDKIWALIFAIANLVFTTCLVLYVVSTLMDGFVSATGLTMKLIVDGVILPLIAWVLVIGFNLYGMYGATGSAKGTWTGIAFAIAAVFWVYLAISGILLNNIVLPTKHRRKKMEPKHPEAAK